MAVTEFNNTGFGAADLATPSAFRLKTQDKGAEQVLLNTLNSVESYVVLTNAEGCIIWWNQATTDTLDCPYSMQQGTPFWEFFCNSEIEHASTRDAFLRIFAGEPVQYWHSGVLTNMEELRFIEWHSTTVSNMNSVILLTGLDVTKYQTYNERLVQQIIQNRKQEQELEYRIAFENIITNLSTKFISLEPDEIDNGIRGALQEIAEFTGDDRSWVILYTDNDTKMANTHEWVSEGLDYTMPHFHGKPISIMPWINAQVLSGEVVHLPRISDLPLPVAAVDRQLIERPVVNNKSNLFVPMVNHGKVIGCLGFDSVRQEKSWPDDIIVLLRLVGEMFTSALERKWIDEKLQKSRRQLSTLMGNLPGMAYRMKTDRNGTFDFVSDGCKELTGYLAHELQNSKKYSYIHFIHPDDRKALRKAIDESIKTGEAYSSTHRIITKNREIKWVREQGCPVSYPGSDALVLEGFITDSTDSVLNLQQIEDYAEQRTREVERRRIAAEGLQDVVEMLNAEAPLFDIFKCIVDQISRLLGTEKVAIYQLERKKGIFYVLAGCGLSENCVIGSGIPVSDAAIDRLDRATEPMLFTFDNKRRPPKDELARELQKIRLKSISGSCRSMMVAPLTISGELFGTLIFYFKKERTLSDEDMDLIATFCNQTELAVKNSRLRKQGEENAKNLERNRIARDLHDSVTQTLFSASIIADTLPHLMKDDPDSLQKNLEQLQFLNREALVEMRTLLLEMRATSLKDANLEQLLHSLSDSYAGRGNLSVSFSVDGDGDLPANVQIYLYRITQEAMNNVVKHAFARKVEIVLNYTKRHAELRVKDNGRGFDPNENPSGHFGLAIMRERTEAVGAELFIKSAPGKGTEVIVNWPASERT